MPSAIKCLIIVKHKSKRNYNITVLKSNQIPIIKWFAHKMKQKVFGLLFSWKRWSLFSLGCWPASCSSSGLWRSTRASFSGAAWSMPTMRKNSQSRTRREWKLKCHPELKLGKLSALAENWPNFYRKTSNWFSTIHRKLWLFLFCCFKSNAYTNAENFCR